MQRPRLREEADVCGCFRNHDESDAANVGCGLMEYLHPLTRDRSLENRKSSKIPAGVRHICDKATADGIADEHEYDRYSVCFLLHDLGHKIGTGHDSSGVIRISSLAKARALLGSAPAQRVLIRMLRPRFNPFPEASAGMPQRWLSFRVAFAISQKRTECRIRSGCCARTLSGHARRGSTNKRDELAPFHTGKGIRNRSGLMKSYLKGVGPVLCPLWLESRNVLCKNVMSALHRIKLSAIAVALKR